MKSRIQASIGLALLCVGCFECAPAGRRQAPAAPAPLSPAAALAVVEQREAAIHTLRARFTAHSRRGDDTHAADGVLLVKKPDRFRLRLMLPLGLTIFDYVSWGHRVQVT